MMLLPPKEGTCPICAHPHEPEAPHNQQSLYYQYRFYGIRGRWPTWADAVAHCEPGLAALWREELTRRGAWSEPADGEPIADPNEPTFGPQVTTEIVRLGEDSDAPLSTNH